MARGIFGHLCVAHEATQRNSQGVDLGDRPLGVLDFQLDPAVADELAVHRGHLEVLRHPGRRHGLPTGQAGSAHQGHRPCRLVRHPGFNRLVLHPGQR